MDEQATTSTTGDVEVAIVDEKPEQRTSNTGTLRIRERDDGHAESRTLLQKYIAAGFTPGGGRTELAWQDWKPAPSHEP